MLFTYKYGRDESIEEEIANAGTHGIGVILSIYALIVLTSHSMHQHNNEKLISSILFAVTLIFTYTSSTLYHLINQPKIKNYLKICDHIAIYLLIAGTYTPLTLITLHGYWGHSLFWVIWSLAIMGTIFTVFSNGGFEFLAMLVYLFMGWIALIAIVPIYHALPLHGFLWLLSGGIFYTLGAVFFMWHYLRYNHTIMHVLVLAGSICHYFAILYYVVLV